MEPASPRTFASPVRVALLLAALALVPRLVFVLVAGGDYQIFRGAGDVWSYHQHAELMLSGWRAYLTTPLLLREPVYPAFMALAYLLPGDDVFGLQLMQALLGAATTALLYLGLRTQVRHGVALGSAALVALNPHFVLYTRFGYREHVIIFLLAALVVLLLRTASRSTWGGQLALAGVLALLVHTDVRFLPLSAVVPLLLWILCGAPRRAGVASARVFLLFGLLMVPYQVRSSVAAGRPIVVTERFLDRWLPLVHARFDAVDLPQRGNAREEWLGQWMADKQRELGTVTREERELFLGGARPELRRLPVYAFLFREYWSLQPPHATYRPYPDGRFVPWRSLRYYGSTLIELGPFFLALLVAWRGPSSWERRVFWALAAFLAAHCLLHVAVHAIDRYRVPMEVVTSVITALGAMNAWDWLAVRRGRAAVVPARVLEDRLRP